MLGLRVPPAAKACTGSKVGLEMLEPQGAWAVTDGADRMQRRVLVSFSIQVRVTSFFSAAVAGAVRAVVAVVGQAAKARVVVVVAAAAAVVVAAVAVGGAVVVAAEVEASLIGDRMETMAKNPKTARPAATA